jgi:hypothetical protein
MSNRNDKPDAYWAFMFFSVLFLMVMFGCFYGTYRQAETIRQLRQRVNDVEVEIATQARIESAIKERAIGNE